MSTEIKESDWRIFRELHPIALELYEGVRSGPGVRGGMNLMAGIIHV